MANLLKREYQEIRSYKEHMSYIPTSSENVEDNFQELVRLFGRASSPHILIGTADLFTIVQKKLYNVLALIGLGLFLLFLFVSVYGIATEPDGPAGWLFLTVVIALFIINIKYGKSPSGVYWGITIDRSQKTITIFDNNIIRRRFATARVLAFDDVQSLINEEKIISGKGQTHTWQKISARTDYEDIPILSLPNGPLYFMNHEVFMTCLKRIIRRNANAH